MNGYSAALAESIAAAKFSHSEALSNPIGRMWANEQFSIIKRYVQDFESSLDAEHEVGISLTNFGQSVLMQVAQIAYEDPVLMIFKGSVDGREATLIQHVNQLNFMLTTVDKEPDRPKRQIGFNVVQEE